MCEVSAARSARTNAICPETDQSGCRLLAAPGILILFLVLPSAFITNRSNVSLFFSWREKAILAPLESQAGSTSTASADFVRFSAAPPPGSADQISGRPDAPPRPPTNAMRPLAAEAGACEPTSMPAARASARSVEIGLFMRAFPERGGVTVDNNVTSVKKFLHG